MYRSTEIEICCSFLSKFSKSSSALILENNTNAPEALHPFFVRHDTPFLRAQQSLLAHSQKFKGMVNDIRYHKLSSLNRRTCISTQTRFVCTPSILNSFSWLRFIFKSWFKPAVSSITRFWSLMERYCGDNHDDENENRVHEYYIQSYKEKYLHASETSKYEAWLLYKVKLF